MRSKQGLYRAAAVVFWLAVWEVTARCLDLPFAIPTVPDTAGALLRLCGTAAFWQTVGASLWRILEGLLLGTALGAILAMACAANRLADAIVRPAMLVIRCTPVASFIMVLWILVGRDAVPSAIALLMVLPVIWQGMTDGYRALEPALNDVVRVFHASPLQRLTMFVLPSLRRAFVTAFVTAAGLAWKAGIAAEIIAYTAHSIGREIANARNLFSGADMMAWTVCVVLMSIAMEAAIKHVLSRKA